MTSTSRSAFLAMAALSLGGIGSMASVPSIGVDMAQPGSDRTAQTPIRNNSIPSMADIFKAIGGGLGNGPRRSQRRSGPGWTNAHAKRIARKARNVKRHRITSRGKA